MEPWLAFGGQQSVLDRDCPRHLFLLAVVFSVATKSSEHEHYLLRKLLLSGGDGCNKKKC